MRLSTLCSGIGAPEVAAKRLGWECLWSAEVDSQASAVLAHHHPESVNLGDVTKIHGGSLERPDVLVFGTPCQSFSVAGKGAGMDDPRGILAFVALGIVDALRPEWFIFENVPGIISRNKGRNFEAFLCAVDGCGYSGAWASPDSQWFGVAQQRRRVFFVGHIGDWRYPASVLSQFSRLSGHPAPSREAGAVVTQAVTGRLGGGGPDDNKAQGGFYVTHDVAPCIQERGGKGPDSDCTMALVAHTTGAGFWKEGAGTIRARAQESHEHLVAQTVTAGMYRSGGAVAGNNNQGVRNCFPVATGIRRLMPVEVERLFGFPDDYTLIPYKGKPMADGPRYKMLGNSMAVPVILWILERIGSL